ncbi:splicing factor 1-like isoform X2 [Dermacentor variabilis]
MTGAPPVVSMLPSWASQDENSNTSMGSMGSMGSLEANTGERRRKRRSRWCCDEKEKVFIPGMPTVLPTNLDPNQERAYLLQLQIEELSRRLRTEDLGIPFNPEDRSPSPEPIYNSAGKRLNTREYRVRKKLEDERHVLIQEMFTINQEYKPPSDYKPPLVRVSEKVMIPQEEHPDINFVGLLIGPRGNTLKSLEKETGAKIIIRGKGSVKEGKVGRKDGQPLPGEDEPLHAFVTASSQENVRKAVDRIKEIIRQGVEVPEGQNDLRRMQLRELALLNGTLRENDLLGGPRCSNCGAPGHKAWQCPDRPNITNNVICACCGGTGHIARDCRERGKSGGSGYGGRGGFGGSGDGGPGGAQSKIDEEYMSLMAELGEGPPPPSKSGGDDASNRGSSGPQLGGTQGPIRAIMAPPPLTGGNAPLGMDRPPPQQWAAGPKGMMPPGGPRPPTMMGGPPPPHMAGTGMPWQPSQGGMPPMTGVPPPPPMIGPPPSGLPPWMAGPPQGPGAPWQTPIAGVPPPPPQLFPWGPGGAFMNMGLPPPPPPPPAVSTGASTGASTDSTTSGASTSATATSTTTTMVDLSTLAVLPGLLAAPPPPPPPS